MLASDLVIAGGFGSEERVPRGTLLYHSYDASVVTVEGAVRGGGGTVVDVVEVGANAACVGICGGAGVGSNAADGRFEFQEGACDKRENWPTSRVDAEARIERS